MRPNLITAAGRDLIYAWLSYQEEKTLNEWLNDLLPLLLYTTQAAVCIVMNHHIYDRS